MKIGMITDSLADLSVDELVRTAAESGWLTRSRMLRHLRTDRPGSR